MALDAKRRDVLIAAVAQTVPGMTLRAVVGEQGVVDDFDDFLRKSVPQDPARAAEEIARKVVLRYEAADALRRLVEGLLRRCFLDDGCYAALAPFVAELAGPASGQQAAIALRAHTLSNSQLRRFMASIEGKLCVIASVGAGHTRLGTGVLVGADLVLTAYHTLREHIRDGKAHSPAGSALYAFFDHCDAGPIVDPHDPAIRALRVPFAADWLIASCCDMPEEATIRDATDEQVEALQNNLDYALVRLNQPIGNHSRDAGAGGERRAWFELHPPQAYRADDRIFIPQHPQGHAQQIDFGRYSKEGSDLDRSSTRIRYDTETDDGTSGAPCFNQYYQFAGLHTAAFMPGGVAVDLNQAVRGDRILQRLNGLLPQPPAPPAAPAGGGPAPMGGPAPAAAKFPVAAAAFPAARFWNAAAPKAPLRPILGRGELLAWIARASQAGAGGLDVRVHVAAGSQKRCGRSFSTEILLAARRASSEDVIVSLGNGDQLPLTVEDFIGAVTYQLRLPAAELATMPQRPGLDTAVAVAGQEIQSDADKLSKWMADDLPLWFARLLQRCRSYSVDLRVEAQVVLDGYIARGENAPQLIRDLAAAPQPRLESRSRWERCWIVLDDLHSASLSDELRVLLAGLIGARLSAAAVPEELLRLRWLFLGAWPDFLLGEAVSSEVLAPEQMNEEHLLQTVNAFADSTLLPLDERTCRIVFNVLFSQLPLNDLETRLAKLQEIAVAMIHRLGQPA